ncbi:methyltransferase family protein [Motilibacter rhizosphaerae]|uniref:Methyltransferase family protein n=1 Tax=Motilibacter rhizosphaerae TaxID=598652 RepID=A0A4Q7NP66_9ACTN|nr:class I SAM-dependent methyltransferase [Motilibacter rhizosphaerae]RZS86963.1 methyltransferase family protein [Motilibacter rhizosphaerae]
MADLRAALTRARGDAWGSWAVARGYEVLEGPVDAGETAALEAVEEASRGDVLDIGVGAGRTTALLAPSARHYQGIDSSPGMLARASARFPGVELRVGDARSLDGVASGSQDLVVFSYNGIDCVAHEDRARVLAEVRRVLRPGGRFVLSTLNLDGPEYARVPRLERYLERPSSLRQAPRSAVRALRYPRALVGYWRTAARAQRGEDWATWPLEVHGFRFLCHFSTVDAVLRELAAAGLRVDGAWTGGGERLDLAEPRTSTGFVHLACTAG